MGLRHSLKLNIMKNCLYNRRLLWFGHLERMEECS